MSGLKGGLRAGEEGACQEFMKGYLGVIHLRIRLDPASEGFLEKWIRKENNHHLMIPAEGQLKS